MGRFYAREGSKGQQIVCVKSNKVTKSMRAQARKKGGMVATPYMGGRIGRTRRGRAMKRLSGGAWYHDVYNFGKRVFNKGADIFRKTAIGSMLKPALDRIAQNGLDQGVKLGQVYGKKALKKGADYLRQRFGDQYAPFINWGENMLRNEGNKYLIKGRDYVRAQYEDAASTFFRPRPNITGFDDPYEYGYATPMASGLKRLKVHDNDPFKKMKVGRGFKSYGGTKPIKYGGSMLSGPIP